MNNKKDMKNLNVSLNAKVKPFVFLIAFMVSIIMEAQAVTYTWTGATSTAWATTTNWSPNGNPGSAAGDIVNIGATSFSGSQPTLSVAPVNALASITLGTATASTLTISANYLIGSLSIGLGSTVSESGAITVTFTGGITNNGTYTASTGTHTFATNAQALSGIITIPSITVTTITLTNSGTITCATALSGTGRLTNTGTLNIGTASAITTLTATAAGNTVNYTGAGQTVKATSYYHLGFSGSGGKSVTGVTAIGGDFTISGTATCSMIANTLIGGNLTINTGTTVTWPNPFAGVISGNVSGAGTITAGGTARAVSVGGNWTFNGTCTSSLAVTLNGTGAQTLSGVINQTGATNGSLIINKLRGTVTLGSNMTIVGTTASTFILTAGTFDPAIYKLTATTPTFTAGTLKVGGANWAANYSVAITEPLAGTIEYYASGAQTVNPVAYGGSLTLSGSGLKTIAAGAAVTGKLNITGTAKASLASGVNLTIHALSLGGTDQASGTYGSTISAATNKNDTYFDNTATFTGILTITVTNPITCVAVGGTWGTAATWSPAVVPTIADDVVIANTSVSVTIGAAASCANLTINNGSTLNVGAFALTVGGTTTIGSGSSGLLTITSSTGVKTFQGLVTINSGGSWTNTAANSAVSFWGGITNNGTFSAGTAVHSFTTSLQELSGTLAIPSITVTGTTLTNNGTLTCATALSGTGELANGGTGTLNIGTASTITTLTASATGNIVNYTGVAQTVKPTTYYDLGLSGSLAKTMTGVTTIINNFSMSGSATATPVITSIGGNVSITGTAQCTAGANNAITGTLTIGSGTAYITASTFTLGVTGATTVSGTFTLGGTGAVTLTGDVSISGTWNETGVKAYSFGGNFSNNATSFTANTGIHTFSGASKTIDGTFTNSIGSVTFTGSYTHSGTLSCATALNITGGTLNNSGTLSGAGTLTNNATGTVNITGGTCGITTLANAGTLAMSGTSTSTTALANFTNTGTINISGSGAITGITNNAAGIVNHSGSSTITSFNNASATSTLNISTTPTVPTITTLTATFTGNAVNFNGEGSQTIPTGTYDNLSISGTGAKTAGGNITINGTLTLPSVNASATSGALEMNSYTLTMGATATTAGTGDVSGIVTRNTFVDNTPYSFGNQYTTITFAAGGTAPSSLSVKVVLTASHAWKANAIDRYYDMIQTGGNSAKKAEVNLHYLVSELNACTESDLSLFDYQASPYVLEEHGSSNDNILTQKWVGLSNISLTYLAKGSFDTKYWTLATSVAGNDIYWAGNLSTDWNETTNWSGSMPVPNYLSHVHIPDVASSNSISPALPDTGATIGKLTMDIGGVLNATSGTPILTVIDSSGAWSNSGTFNAGSSTVIFTNAAATMADPTNFYNVTIASGAALTLGTDNIMRIAGTFTNSGTLNAGSNHNTIEYNGIDQTVIVPNGSTPGYHNLILSGSGTKTLPSSTLTIAGDFTNNGTMAHNSGTLSFNGASAQSINGSGASTFNHISLNNVNGLSVASSSNTSISGTLTLTSGKIAIGSNTLTLGGSISGMSASNSFTSSSSSNLTLNSALGTIYFDQSTPNTTNVIKNLTLGISATATLGNALNITAGASAGIVSVASGATLASAGLLTIKSDVNGTAKVVESPGSITGNVTVERYIPAGRRAFRFLSSAVYGTTIFDAWQEGGNATVGNGIHIPGGAAIGASGFNASSGFDNTLTGASSMFTMFGSAWAAVANTKSTDFTPGMGYRVFVRGDRTTDIFASNPTPTTNDATVLRGVGTLNQGDVSIALSNGGSAYNLVGNPYPCAISWDNGSWASARTGIDNAIYLYSPDVVASVSSTGYGAWAGGVGTNGVSDSYIRPGQGFFVHATTAAPTLTFKEVYKSNGFATGGFFKKQEHTNLLRIEYLFNGNHADEIVIRFKPDAVSNAFDRNYDAISLGSDVFGLSSIKANLKLAIQAKPEIVEEEVIPLSVNANQTGSFQLKFTEIESFVGATDIILKDKFLNKEIEFQINGVYDFQITNDSNSKGRNRFEIVFKKSSTGNAAIDMKKDKFILFPNPAGNEIFLSLTTTQEGDYSYEIYNQLGQKQDKGNLEFGHQRTYVIPIENLAGGVYFVKVFNSNMSQTIRFIK